MEPSERMSPVPAPRGRGSSVGSRSGVGSPSRFSCTPVSPPISPTQSNQMESSLTSFGALLLESDLSRPSSRADSVPSPHPPLRAVESSPVPGSPQLGTGPTESPMLARRYLSEHARPHSPKSDIDSVVSVETEPGVYPQSTQYGSYGASVPISILQRHLHDDIRNSSQSIHAGDHRMSESYSPPPAHFGSYKATAPVSIPAKGCIPEYVRSTSRFDSIRSIFSTQQSVSSAAGSHARVNIVTEAAALLPSVCSSAFSIDKINSVCNLAGEVNGTSLDHMAPPSTKTASLHDNLDVLEDPAYTDTVKSTDSNSSLLRRSMSVPSQYHFKPSARRPHAREVFEDFITTEPPKEEDDQVSDLVPTVTGSYPKNKWRQTMDDLYENPEYVDSVQSTSSGAALLARTAVSISKSGKHIFTRITSVIEPPPETPQKYAKNLVILSLSFMLVFSAYLSLRNLQSSINPQGGLALFALASVYGSLFLGCIFATTIVQRLRPKVTMMLCMVSILLYVIANFYPHYYTLVPASMIAGFSLSNMWTAHATYMTNIAVTYAELTGKSVVNVIGKFNGLFFMFFGISQVLGGVISSTVLMSNMSPSRHKDVPISDINALDFNSSSSNYSTPSNFSLALHVIHPLHKEVKRLFDEHENMSSSYSDLLTTISTVVDSNSSAPGGLVGYAHCGAAYRPEIVLTTSAVIISKSQLYLLLGIFTGCTIVGMLILFFCLDRLEGVMKKSHASLWDQLTAVFRWFVDWKVLCLVSMMFYTLIEMAFMFGEFTQAFVTCSYGVHIVGYAMVCMSAASSVSSYLNGELLKYLGRLPLFVGAASLHLSLMITMLMWKPVPENMYVTFIVTGLWGIADGVWFTQIISLLGVLYSHNKEPAFAGLKMCQALGATITFITSKYIPTAVKIYLMMFLLVLALVGYIILDVRLKCIENEAKKVESPRRCTPV